MRSERLLRILAAVASADLPSGPERLGVAGARILAVAGASVMVESDGHHAPLCASDARSAELQDLGLTLGEGPGADAHHLGRPVAEPDLAAPSRGRWPMFTPSALAAGAGAIFSFPLRIGAVRIGSLTLHQTRPGPLSHDQHSDALVLADVILHTVLSHQAGAPPDTLATELEVLSTSQAQVHQASGMVAVQSGVTVTDALVLLRGHAYAEERALSEVARDVVAGRLRLGAP